MAPIDNPMTPCLRFANPIDLTEGGCIATVDEALDFYFSLPMHERVEGKWTDAAKLLVSTFDEKGDTFLEQAETRFRCALGRRTTIIARSAA
jgi:hypothetical protein